MKFTLFNKKNCGISLALFFFVIFFSWSPGSLFAEVEEARVKNDIWSGYWWPLKYGEIINPLTKYDRVTGKKAVEWERKNNPSGENVPDWYGYCHAWAASSVLEKEPQVNRTSGGVLFTVGDQKGLLAASHASDVTNSYGERYDGPESNRNDIAPDELWMVLRRYIKKQGVPVILDIEADTPVWNYPVFAYRVTFEATDSDSSLYNAVMEIWMADDSVDKDFVGLQRTYGKYTFQVKIKNGSIVLGSGKWTGDSQKTHPDFAWFPYVVVPESPEVDYKLVCNILGTKPVSVPGTTTPETTTPETTTPETTTPETTTPETTTPESIQSEGITVEQLLAFVENKKSDWFFDISVDKFDGGKYADNDLITVMGQSKKSGYLYLVVLDTQEDPFLIYPRYSNENNKIESNKEFQIPKKNSLYQFRLKNGPGTYRIKAIVVENKLKIKGLKKNNKTEDFSWTPELADQVSRMLPGATTKGNPDKSKDKEESAAKSEPKTSNKIGRFAQDEVSFVLMKKTKK